MAVSRVLMRTRPSSSTVHVTGDSCGRPSARTVASTARWWAAMNSLASSAFMMIRSGVQPGATAHLVLVHDRARVAVREPVLIGQPVSPFFTAKERGAGVEASEPLREVASRNGRDARDQIFVQLRGVAQGHWHLQGELLLVRECLTPCPPDKSWARAFLITRYEPVTSQVRKMTCGLAAPRPQASLKRPQLCAASALCCSVLPQLGAASVQCCLSSGARRSSPCPGRHRRTWSPDRTSCRGTAGC